MALPRKTNTGQSWEITSKPRDQLLLTLQDQLRCHLSRSSLCAHQAAPATQHLSLLTLGSLASAVQVTSYLVLSLIA